MQTIANIPGVQQFMQSDKYQAVVGPGYVFSAPHSDASSCVVDSDLFLEPENTSYSPAVVVQQVKSLPTLRYFAIRGRVSRILLLAAATGHLNDFTLETITDFPTWGALKGTTPYHAIPVWYDDVVGALPESLTIMRYLGEQWGAYSEGAEKWHVDSLLGYAEDLLRYFGSKIAGNRDETSREQGVQGMRSYADRAEEIAARHGKTFFATDFLSIGDIYLFDAFVNLFGPLGGESWGYIKTLPNLWRIIKTISEIPEISEFMHTEPVSTEIYEGENATHRKEEYTIGDATVTLVVPLKKVYQIAVMPPFVAVEEHKNLEKCRISHLFTD